MDNHHWIFLSPHLDDVALSCSGLVWDLAHKGHIVEIWTLMAGLPPDEPYSDFAEENHLIWGMSGKAAILMRREEDQNACDILGVQPKQFDWADAIYRVDLMTGEPIVNNDLELFGKAPEEWLVDEIGDLLRTKIPGDAQVVLPLGLGGHIDHSAVVKAGNVLQRMPFYYADYPYILESFDPSKFHSSRWRRIPYDLDEEALYSWQESVLCYASQINYFWRDEEEVRLAIRNYLAGGGGRLWQKITN